MKIKRSKGFRLTAVVACVALAAGILGLAGAQAAVAAPSVRVAADCAADHTGPTLQGISPSSFSLGLRPVTMAWAPAASDPCGIAGWAIYRWISQQWYFPKATNATPVVSLPVPSYNYLAGWTDVWLSATDASAQRNVSAGRFPFQLLRRTTFEDSTFDIIKPGAGGSRLSISAKLLRADWRLGRYDYFPGEHVLLQFRPEGSDRWQHVQTLTTNAHARVSYQLDTAGVPTSRWLGQWRLRYLGGPTSASTTSPTVQVGLAGSVRQVAAAVAPEGAVADPAGLLPAPGSVPAVATDCSADHLPPTGVQVSVNGSDPQVSLATQQEAATFTVQALDPCGTGLWDLEHLGFGPAYPAYRFSASNSRPTAQIPPPPVNAVAGYSDLHVAVQDGSPQHNVTEFLTPIRLARATSWPAQSIWLEAPRGANPTLGINAQLWRARWDLGRPAPFPNQMVAVEFLPAGASVWQHMKFARTDERGWLHTRYWREGDPREVFTGLWRVRFPSQERYASSISTARPFSLP